jgi:hypothetical protein
MLSSGSTDMLAQTLAVPVLTWSSLGIESNVHFSLPVAQFDLGVDFNQQA